MYYAVTVKEKDHLPPLSHLQFAVLDVLGTGSVSGKELREELRRDRHIFKTGPGFYQMMSRLEDGGWVEGDYKQEIVNGQSIKERHYKITGEGQRARQATAQFYASAILSEAGGSFAL